MIPINSNASFVAVWGRRSLPFGKMLAVAVVACAVASCVTGPKSPLSLEQSKSLAFDEIHVTTAPTASIWWGEAERDFAASKGCEPPPEEVNVEIEQLDVTAKPDPDSICDYAALIETPEARQYLVQRSIDELRASLDELVKPAFSGSRAAKLHVNIEDVRIVSSGQAILVGGSHTLKADFEVFDAKTETSLARYDDLIVVAGYGPGGLISILVEATAKEEPYERLSDIYANSINAWLLSGVN